MSEQSREEKKKDIEEAGRQWAFRYFSQPIPEPVKVYSMILASVILTSFAIILAVIAIRMVIGLFT